MWLHLPGDTSTSKQINKKNDTNIGQKIGVRAIPKIIKLKTEEIFAAL